MKNLSFCFFTIILLLYGIRLTYQNDIKINYPYENQDQDIVSHIDENSQCKLIDKPLKTV